MNLVLFHLIVILSIATIGKISSAVDEIVIDPTLVTSSQNIEEKTITATKMKAFTIPLRVASASASASSASASSAFASTSSSGTPGQTIPIPAIGLGVYQSEPGSETYDAVLGALRLGYRCV